MGVATSTTLSANEARSSNFSGSFVDARIILTFGGSLCKNNSFKNEGSAEAALFPGAAASAVEAVMGFYPWAPQY